MSYEQATNELRVGYEQVATRIFWAGNLSSGPLMVSPLDKARIALRLMPLSNHSLRI